MKYIQCTLLYWVTSQDIQIQQVIGYSLKSIENIALHFPTEIYTNYQHYPVYSQPVFSDFKFFLLHYPSNSIFCPFLHLLQLRTPLYTTTPDGWTTLSIHPTHWEVKSTSSCYKRSKKYQLEMYTLERGDPGTKDTPIKGVFCI